MKDVGPNSSREETFASLLAANRRRLQTIARSYARGEEQDLLQEILLQLWRSLDGFAGRSSLDTWAYRVALNTAIVWRRKARAEPRENRAVGTADVAAATSGPRDELVILDEFVAGLGPADRAFFVLYLEDLTYRQIAEVTGLSESHVGVKLHRLKRLFMERYL